MQKLNLQDVAKILSTTCFSSNLIQGFSVDSRLCQQGHLFFALPGEKMNGVNFLSDVASKGAIAAVVNRDYNGPDFNISLLRVDDTLIALQNLAKVVLAKSKSRVVAVTGSVGKTTTKDFLSTILGEKYRVSCSPGNNNSQIGVPLTLLNHTDGTEDILVLEMGMTHPGDLSKLLEIAPSECSIITSVGLVHACNFESIEEIARAKAEILAHPQTKIGIINRDIPIFHEVEKVGKCKKISFSFDNVLADYKAYLSDEYVISCQGGLHPLGQLQFSGKHNQQNLLAAVACARYFDLSWDQISSGIQKLRLPDLRGQLIYKEGITFVNDAYNAAPISVKAALESLPPAQSGGRKIAVLADMLELGKFSEISHREIGNFALKYIDVMYCYGNETRYIQECWQQAKRPIYWFSDRLELARSLRDELQKGDVVLIKGSRGTQISKIMEEMEITLK